MNGRGGMLLVALSLLMLPPAALAQVTMQPTPRPLVTAENEGWYVAGEPIVFAGNFYYPAGAQVYFDGNEMVRSGFYLGIPLYTRTTIEPYSVVYVPLAGGLMQPYERRRQGEVAGTVGSTTPSYPVEVASTIGAGFYGGGAGMAQAAAPPTEPPFASLAATAPRANVVIPGSAAVTPPETGTTGTPETPSAPARTAGAKTALKPKGLNGVYIDYDNHRWFNSGHAVLLDPARFTRVGDYRGFSVYQEQGRSDTIYVQLANNVTTFATPYSLRPERRRPS